MTVDLLQHLTNLSTDELSAAIDAVVQQLHGTGAAPIGSVSISKIGRSAGTATAGIFHVSGVAATPTGEKPWSAVVKIIGDSETRREKMDSDAAERELAVYRSGVFASQQGRVRSPHCYAIQEWNGLRFIWQEDLSMAKQPPWRPEHFVQTANHIGQFNARWPEDALPQWEWLSQSGIVEKYNSLEDQQRIERFPDFEKHTHAYRAFPADVMKGPRQLWQESGKLYGRVAEMPKGVCHGDFHPKNLFPMADEGAGSYTVALDWAHVGIEPLGSDIGLMLGSPMKWGELTPDEAAALVDPIFDAYMAGLTEAGWSGNADDVRLSYLASLVGEAIRTSGVIVFFIDKPHSQALFERLLNAPIEQICDSWGEALRFFLSYREQALHLARR